MQSIAVLFGFCLLLSFSTTTYANNKGPTIKEALEMAANQQVLSQRIAKIYLALCHNNRDPQLYQERTKAIEKFEEELYAMSFIIPNDRIKENIQEVRSIWKDYKAIADWTIKNQMTDRLLRQASNLLKATKSLYASYQEYEYTIKAYTIKENSNLITINQYIHQNYNQRVIIEQVMAYYLANKQTVDDLDYSIKLKDAQKAFIRILRILKNAGTTSQSIHTQLKTIEQVWTLMVNELNIDNKDLSKIDEMLKHSAIISSAIRNMIYSYESLGIKISLSHTINQAITQRELVQRIAKAYIASSNEMIAYTYQKQSEDDIARFEEIRNAMLVTAQTDELRAAIHLMDTIWEQYKGVVLNRTSIDENHVNTVVAKCDVVMFACEKIVNEVEKYAQTVPAYRSLSIQEKQPIDKSEDITHQIYLLDELRVLTHRVAQYCMMNDFALNSEMATEQLQLCLEKFANKFEELKNSKLKNSSVVELIENCSSEWRSMIAICNKNDAGHFNEMLLHSQKLAKKLGIITDLYEHQMNAFFAQDMKLEQKN